MSSITIYHNPACGTSRNVLGLIRNSGETPTIIEYLKTPPDAATLSVSTDGRDRAPRFSLGEESMWQPPPAAQDLRARASRAHPHAVSLGCARRHLRVRTTPLGGYGPGRRVGSAAVRQTTSTRSTRRASACDTAHPASSPH